MNTAKFPDWVTHARAFPLAFAQVREDPLIDLWVAKQLPPRSRGLMVASGGCTAAALSVHSNFSLLHLADVSSTQIKLTQLKLKMLSEKNPAERRALLGHDAMVSDVRARELAVLGFGPELFGDASEVARLGPDYVGRYEFLFAALQRQLLPWREKIMTLCEFTSPHEQKRHITGTPIWFAIEDAFQEIMTLTNLVALFGEGATQNPVIPFADHFVSRTRHALSTMPANTNPFLWQVLLGRFPCGANSVWLESPLQRPNTALEFSTTAMCNVLKNEDRKFHFIHLSNILDWLSVEEAGELLDVAAKRLVSGGWVIIRQLNSSLDIPALGGSIKFLPDEGERLLRRDKSFFYQQLHIGRKM